MFVEDREKSEVVLVNTGLRGAKVFQQCLGRRHKPARENPGKYPHFAWHLMIHDQVSCVCVLRRLHVNDGK